MIVLPGSFKNGTQMAAPRVEDGAATTATATATSATATGNQRCLECIGWILSVIV